MAELTLRADQVKGMNVPRLKEELKKRGLDASGLKPDLAARLEAAVVPKNARQAR